MTQEKFENYGRTLLIIMATFAVIYLMFIIVAKTYSTYQDNELRSLEKENMELQKNISQKEIEKIEREIKLLNE